MDACLPMNLAMPVTAPPESDDSALVRRASAGDMRAFELLYRKHVGRVYGAVLRIVGMNHARAEELTQEAFVRAWQKLAGFRFESAFSTWLYRLGVNTALMARRRERPGHEPLFFENQASQPPVEPIPSDLEQLYAAIDRLDLPEKSLVLLWLDDLSYAEISEITGLAPTNIGVKLNRIRARLREWMAPDFRGEN